MQRGPLPFSVVQSWEPGVWTNLGLCDLILTQPFISIKPEHVNMFPWAMLMLSNRGWVLFIHFRYGLTMNPRLA